MGRGEGQSSPAGVGKERILAPLHRVAMVMVVTGLVGALVLSRGVEGRSSRGGGGGEGVHHELPPGLYLRVLPRIRPRLVERVARTEPRVSFSRAAGYGASGVWPRLVARGCR